MNSAPAIAIEPPTDVGRWMCHLLQTTDTLYPTGGYAHSCGLEGLVQANVVRDRATLHAYIFGSVMPALEQAELPLVAQAWRALRERDWAKVAAVSETAAALKTARELRLAAEAGGRQRAELAALLHPESIATEYLDRARNGAWPFAATVSAAVEAQVVHAPVVAAMTSYAYASLASVMAAAMKLLRLGQNGAQSLLTEALAQVPGLLASAQAIPLHEVGWFNPWLDIVSAHHESAHARMFIS